MERKYSPLTRRNLLQNQNLASLKPQLWLYLHQIVFPVCQVLLESFPHQLYCHSILCQEPSQYIHLTCLLYRHSELRGTLTWSVRWSSSLLSQVGSAVSSAFMLKLLMKSLIVVFWNVPFSLHNLHVVWLLSKSFSPSCRGNRILHIWTVWLLSSAICITQN